VLALWDFEAWDFEVWEFAALDFGVVLLVRSPVFEVAVDACPSAHHGDAHTLITAKAQPAPSHLVTFARFFPLGSKRQPQNIRGQRSAASKTLTMILPHSPTTDH
jgi:hypothetical protein